MELAQLDLEPRFFVYWPGPIDFGGDWKKVAVEAWDDENLTNGDG